MSASTAQEFSLPLALGLGLTGGFDAKLVWNSAGRLSSLLPLSLSSFIVACSYSACEFVVQKYMCHRGAAEAEEEEEEMYFFASGGGGGGVLLFIAVRLVISTLSRL